MAHGKNSTIHPPRVPINRAHERIDDRVRLHTPNHRMGDADDVDTTLRPLNGHALMYDQLTGQWKPVLSPPLVTFHGLGAFEVAESGRFPCGSDGRVIQAAAVLTTAGSSTTTADLNHTTSDGATTTTLATYTFASGNLAPNSYPDISFVFAQYDWLWLDITAAGTGAEELVVPVWATAP